MRFLKWLGVLLFVLLGSLPARGDGLVSNTFQTPTPGAGIRLINTGIRFHQIIWNVNGTLTSCTVQLDSSADGVTWNSGDVISGQACTANGSSILVSDTVNFVRINPTALVLSGAASLVVTWTGYVNNPNGSTVSTGSGNPVGVCAANQVYVDPTTGNFWSCNGGAWLKVGPGTATAPGSNGALVFNNNGSLGGSTFTLVCNSTMAGADMGAKINTCTAALPVNGGVADLSQLAGAQTISTAVAVPAGVTLRFGANTQVSQSAAITLPNANSAIACPENRSALFTKAANIDQFTLSGTDSIIRFCALAGVGGSFTGRGIVLSNANSRATAEHNTVNNEAGNAIDDGSNLAVFNQISAGTVNSGSHAISVGNNGTVAFNVASSTNADTIISIGNFTSVVNNNVSLLPAAATSGLAAIDFNADQIGSRSLNNFINITDANAGNVDYGVLDKPTGTHNMNMVFEGDRMNSSLSGGAAAYCSAVNNAANLNTNWSVTFRDEACVHSTATFQALDTQGNLIVVEDPQTGDTSLVDGTTTAIAIKWILNNGFPAFSGLPSVGISANGSMMFCSNCTPTTPTLTGGTGSFLVKTNGLWNGMRVSAPVFGQLASTCSAAASSCTMSFPAHTVPGDTIVVAVDCSVGASPTLAVSDVNNGSYTAVATVKSNPSVTFWSQMFYFPASVPGGTITASSSVNTCTNILAYAVTYRGILQASPLDVAATPVNGNGGSLAITISGMTQGDLIAIEPDDHALGCGLGAGAGITNRVLGGNQIQIGDAIAPATGTFTANWTCNAGDWIMQAFSLKIAP